MLIHGVGGTGIPPSSGAGPLARLPGASDGSGGDILEPQPEEVAALAPALAGALCRYLATPASKIYDDVTEGLLLVRWL